MQKHDTQAYWKENIRIVISLLVVWWLVSYGAGIIFADYLNSFRMGGYKLGFWFAQQGSIFVFVGIIFFYVWRMNKLDKKYDLDE